jgi:2-dehydro-3-deoxygalactonokinase
VLDGRLTAGVSVEYLSGLLVGDEIRCALDAGPPPRALVGDAALCERYTVALRLFGVPDVPRIDDAAPAGLWRVAQAAGLVTAP